MAGFTLGRVEPVGLGVHAAAWDQPSERRQRRQPRYAARRRLLDAVAPGQDPELCEVECHFGPGGELEVLVIRNIETGQVLAHLTGAQFARLSAGADQRGLLFERRG
ncbi:MAG: hypothetical protein ACM3S1_09110 [Hyphomicrobiales bacterium]